MHKALLGDMAKESLCNNFPVPTAVQTKFAPIVHLFTSYH